MTEHAIDPAFAIEEAARRLRDAKMTGAQCEPVSSLLSGQDIEAAYAVQQLNVERRIARGQRLIGRKIGLTSMAVQRQLGVSQPDYGALLSDMIVGDGATLPPEGLLQPKVEAEVALVLGSDLTWTSPMSRMYCAPSPSVLPVAIEIVDSRIRDWKISWSTHHRGQRVQRPLRAGHAGDPGGRLRFRRVRRGDDDQRCAGFRGDGRACMGSSLNAAVWLARRMRQLGTPLRGRRYRDDRRARTDVRDTAGRPGHGADCRAGNRGLRAGRGRI